MSFLESDADFEDEDVRQDKLFRQKIEQIIIDNNR